MDRYPLLRKYVTVGITLSFIGICLNQVPASHTEKAPLSTSSNQWLYVGGSGPGNYTKIQDAIDNASTDNILFVFNGTYPENILINKSIRLIGQDTQSTRIKGINSKSVVTVVSDSIVISGFSIFNGSNGLEILSDFCEISNTNISQNKMSGIKLLQTNYTKINGNTIRENVRGISVFQSTNNSIFDNLFQRNNRALSLWYFSDNNSLSSNTFFLNNNDCISLYYSSHNLVIQNIFTHNNYSIFLYQSSKNIFRNNTISFNNDVGILLEHSFDNLLYGNTIVENRNGIYLYFSYLNSIINNSIYDNIDAGLYCSTVLDNSSLIYDPISVDIHQPTRHSIVKLTEENVLLGNYLANNTKGIVVEDTTNITIQSNNIIYNKENGVELINAVDCVLSHNSICNNQHGIKVVDSSNCLIQYHTFSENMIHAFFINSTRINWDSNYWDNWLIHWPKPILGFTKKNMLSPSIQFDYTPLHEPNNLFSLPRMY